jgi:phosphoribosyl 1,2-cyclic phosphodiesterase
MLALGSGKRCRMASYNNRRRQQLLLCIAILVLIKVSPDQLDRIIDAAYLLVDRYVAHGAPAS